MEKYRLKINGEWEELLAPPYHTLLEVLREKCGLTATKHGCELGECGMCLVLIDQKPTLSCLKLIGSCQDKSVETLEGLNSGETLHPLQTAFLELGAAQCGYCTGAMILGAKSLLEKNPNPTRLEIKQGLAGVLCRCTGYNKIIDAVELAGKRLQGQTISAKLKVKIVDSPDLPSDSEKPE